MVKNRVSIWVAFEEEEDYKDFDIAEQNTPGAYFLEVPIEEALEKLMGRKIHATIKTVTHEEKLQSSVTRVNASE